MATLRVLTGIIVERRQLLLPAGLVVGAPDCRVSPEDCCPGSGSGAPGCCYPTPPAVLYAARYDGGADCACVPLCVVLTYDPALDAWYSPDLGPACGVHSLRRLRLRCRDGNYAMDVTDASDAALVTGVPDVSLPPSCDPFFFAAKFVDDVGGQLVLCDGDYSYAIIESDCRPRSGSGAGGSGASGGGGGTVTACCPDDVWPRTLRATFSTSSLPLACLDGLVVTLVNPPEVGVQNDSWLGTLDACGKGPDQLILECSGGVWSVGSSLYEILASAPAVTCRPPLLVFDNVTVAGVGSGVVRITIAP